MQTLQSEGGLPRAHGVDRAAARVHQASNSKRIWGELDEGAKMQYRAAVGHLLRDLGPEPNALHRIPLLWWSATWGVLQAERENWATTKLVHPISFDRDLVMELPDDAIPMSPVQSCKPGKSLDDIRRHVSKVDREQAA